MHILLAEDNLDLLESLTTALEIQGYRVDGYPDGDEALYHALTGNCDVMVLDVNLPGSDGFSIARNVRSQAIDTPILFLTARDAISDKLEGFQSGADDYLVKPFATEELYARIQALLKRSAPLEGSLLICGNLSLDPKRRVVHVGDLRVPLTGKEFTILEYFLINKDSILSQDQIATRLWEVEKSAESNAVNVHIHNLRKKLRQNGSLAHIETVRGMGYRLIAASQQETRS